MKTPPIPHSPRALSVFIKDSAKDRKDLNLIPLKELILAVHLFENTPPPK